MANRCYLKVFVLREELPDDIREQYRALYKAQVAAKKKFKDSGFWGEDYDSFISSQPGVPFERTKQTYGRWEFKDDQTNPLIGTLKPDSEQWNMPTIHADFYK